MNDFITRHAARVMGVLSGFDRIVFRGRLRYLSHPEGLARFLSHLGVLFKDFGDFAHATTERLKARSLRAAQSLGRPQRYLTSCSLRKEDVARKILETDPIDQGLICVLSCVEPCQTFEIHRSRKNKLLELRSQTRKCLHLYHYFQHRRFGFMHVRLQTWFPFLVQVCLNGREWLARELRRKGIDFEQADNCLPWVSDLDVAQRLLNEQVDLDWTRQLDRLALQVNPALPSIVQTPCPRHYWTAHQIEWATDVMFGDAASLQAIYRPLVQSAIAHFGSPDVMRFLGWKSVHAFSGQVVSDFKDRTEGVRIKHSVDRNSVKAYDKHGSILRAEATINDPTRLRALRPHHGTLRRQPLRKTVADLHRIAKVGQEANERYLDALAGLGDHDPLKDLLAGICRRVSFRGRKLRALRPWDDDDVRLFQAVVRGEFHLQGFRNCDIAARLFPSQPPSEAERQRRRSKVTRLLRLLRAHGLIRKVPHAHRYRCTTKGHRIIAAILAARDASVSALLNVA